jgi:hypothetical protein
VEAEEKSDTYNANNNLDKKEHDMDSTIASDSDGNSGDSSSSSYLSLEEEIMTMYPPASNKRPVFIPKHKRALLIVLELKEK